jgi:hypothetical protein
MAHSVEIKIVSLSCQTDFNFKANLTALYAGCQINYSLFLDKPPKDKFLCVAVAHPILRMRIDGDDRAKRS